jgi:hypothetical protein
MEGYHRGLSGVGVVCSPLNTAARQRMEDAIQLSLPANAMVNLLCTKPFEMIDAR